MKSWKTTVAGIIAGLVPLLTAVAALLDGDPATEPNWTLAISGVVIAIGFITARDNSVTSESAGAK